jgi:hypothetical protein
MVDVGYPLIQWGSFSTLIKVVVHKKDFRSNI